MRKKDRTADAGPSTDVLGSIHAVGPGRLLCSTVGKARFAHGGLSLELLEGAHSPVWRTTAPTC